MRASINAVATSRGEGCDIAAIRFHASAAVSIHQAAIRDPLAGRVERDRLTNERFEGGLVNVFSLADVDCPGTFPSRPELKRPAGSLRDAPLAKVSFTTLL